MAQLSNYSVDFLAKIAKDIAASGPEARAPEVEADAAALACLEGASVLHVFTLQDLAQLDGAEKAATIMTIRRASYSAPGYAEQVGRSLNPDERETALRRIADAKRALELIDRFPTRIMSPTQRFFEMLLADQTIDIERLMHTELIALREANRWAEQLSKRRFDYKQLDVAIESAAAVSPIEHLLTEEFLGRERQLNELRVFTGVRERSLYDKVTDFVQGGEGQILFVEGLGGIGKTALIGHFLFSSRSDADGPLFPFAYLPCDDSALDIRQGHTLLISAAHQFMRLVGIRRAISGGSRAVADFDDEYERFLRESKSYGKERDALTSRRSQLESQEQRLQSSRDQFRLLTEAFAKLSSSACVALKRPVGDIPPALIFIDTFEEVQYYAREQLAPFWDLFSTLFANSKSIRLLIAGRPPLAMGPKTIRQKKMSLVELEQAAAVELLHRETKMPRESLESVARQIGGNPLNLRLAARILIDEGAPSSEGITDLQTRRFGLFRLGPEVIRGRLYRRLLERIHEEDVRQLAHPGMALRRVTPEIIEKVLAPACRLEAVDEARARILFEALKAEHTLVRLDVDSSLRYREDVRAPVLKMLIADEPEQTLRIHRLAMNFYQSREDAASIAEFIYHGLMSGVDQRWLDQAWRPEAERFLNTAVNDLPPEGQIWLASRMSLDIDPELRATADTAAWERITGPNVLTLLEHDGSNKALELLGQRRDRTPESALDAIEARCLMSIGRLDDAEQLLGNALDRSPVYGNRGRQAELFWLLCQVRLSRGNPTAAIAALKALIEISSEMRCKLPLVQALATLIQLTRSDGDDVSSFQHTLLKTLKELRDGEIQREPDVVRAGVASLSVETVIEARSVIRHLTSSLFDIVRKGMIKPQEKWIRELRNVLVDAPSRDGLKRFAHLTPEIVADGAGGTMTLLESATEAIRRSQDQTPTAEQVYAAQIIWIILQMETGTLQAATLAGLDEYRPDWHRTASDILVA